VNFVAMKCAPFLIYHTYHRRDIYKDKQSAYFML